MRPRYCVGIDPGLSGAVTIMRFVDNKWSPVLVADTPTVKVKKGRKTRRQFVTSAMVWTIQNLPKNTVAVLERVHSLPNQGVHSMFLMGHGLGIWEGIITALGYRLEWVSPQRWKKAMLGVGKQEADKEASVREAIRLYPKWSDKLRRKKDHGRAESILICVYGVQTFF